MAGFEEEFEKIYIRCFHDVFLFLKNLSKDESMAEVFDFAKLQKTVTYEEISTMAKSADWFCPSKVSTDQFFDD